MSNADTRADIARRDHEGVPPLSSSSQIGHFIKWKRAKRRTAPLHEAGYLLLGLVSIATVTGLYSWLDVPLVSAAFTYLVVLVLLALVSNFSSLIVLSFIGVCFLSYFFAPPIYSFRVDYPQDLMAISAFVITSLVINFLVTRVRVEQRDHMRTCETLRDANQQLEVTNNAWRIENVERKRAEQALRESEYKLRQLFETEPGLIWSMDSYGSEGKKAEVHPGFMAQVQAILNVLPAYTWYGTPSGSLTFLNKRQADFLGVPKDHPLRFGIDIGAQWDDWVPLLHPDEHEEARKYWSNCLRTGEGGEHNYRVRDAEGDYRWFLTRAEPLRASDGTLLLWIGVTLDIEELKCTEEALRESEYKLRQIVETVPGLVWSLAADGEPTHFNQRLLDYFGKPFEDFKHRGRGAFLHPDDVPEHEKAFSHAIQTGTSYQGVLRLRRADGEYLWHHARAEPLRDREGRIVQWYGLSVDIDEAKKAEDRLRRSEANLAEAQRLSHTGSWVLNPGTRKILYWSEECYRIWGFDPVQAPPYRAIVMERIHPDDRDRVYYEAQEALRQKRDYTSEFRIVLPDGTLKYLEAIGHHVFSAQGELVEVVGTNVDVTERKRAEQALRESEAKIRRLVDANIIGIFIWDFDGRILEANEAFLNIVGYDREDLVAGSIRWTDLTPPEWRDRDKRLIQEQKVNGTLQPFEKEYFRKDGSRVPVLMGVATFEESGNQGVAFVLDLTERKRAEEALRRSEAYLAEAQRLSHCGVASYNETTILYGSDEIFRIWGFDPAQGVPNRKAVFQRIHPSDRDRLSAEVQHAVGEKRGYSIGYRIVLPDGTVKYLESIGQPVFSACGKLVEIVTTQIDVTARKHAEQALRESEGKFRDYAQTASDWFWEIGPDYKFTLLTENAFGLRPADRIGTACWEHALDLQTEPEKWRLMLATLDSRKPFRDFVYRGLDGNGSPMYVKASGKPVFDANGEFRGYRGTGTDVTATVRAQEEHARLRQLESDLAHMNRLCIMGELTASLAHEITQPIATARNNARAALGFLDRSPPDLSEVREALECVVADADRAGDIIDRIRDQIKKAPPRKGRFDLNQAIDEVIVLAQSAINKNGVLVQTHLTEGLAPVQGDRVQLQQVVLNLILNAAEAMSSAEVEARELLITTEQNQAGDVLVAVRDSGPGIDLKHVERVFEAFYTTKSSGVGMGLSICRSIIDAHGGRLWADVNEPRGAAFQFTLPRAEEELMNPLPADQQAGEPREDTASDASHQLAYEGNKRLHRPRREPAQRHWGRQ